MGKMDRLSRRPDWKVGVDKNNENQIIIKDNWLHRIKEVIIEEPEVEILEKIKNARDKDKEVVRIVEEMKKAEVKVIQGEEWKMEGELILKEEKVYIPKDEELRTEIIRLYHDVLMVGHEENGRQWNWWPGVTREVEWYVEGCDLCQRMKKK